MINTQIYIAMQRHSDFLYLKFSVMKLAYENQNLYRFYPRNTDSFL